MVLVVRVFDETEKTPKVLVETAQKPRGKKSREKVIRKSDGTLVRGVLEAMAADEHCADMLDMLVQGAFELGLEYAAAKKRK